jgi:hypothetical protein
MKKKQLKKELKELKEKDKSARLTKISSDEALEMLNESALESDLKPSVYKRLVAQMSECPFCGVHDGDVMVIHFHHWVGSCRKCDSQGPVASSPEEAVRLYNKRADCQ